MEIKNISILSCKQYHEHFDIIPALRQYWWTKTASFSPGRIHRIKDWDDTGRAGLLPDSACGVRPCAVLQYEPSDKEFWMNRRIDSGSKLHYGLWDWTVLEASGNELFVLCDSIVAIHPFDRKTNEWDNSYLKRWLETYGNEVVSLYDIASLGEIESIGLLTEKEYHRSRQYISDLSVTWWLRSSYDALPRYCYTDIPRNVCVNRDGEDVKHSIRPVIKIRLDDSARRLRGFLVSVYGLVFNYGKYTWTVLDYDPTTNIIFALCNTTIGRRTFGKESQTWETSDLKAWLETDGIKKITTRRKNT
jgi:hypothetical protein